MNRSVLGLTTALLMSALIIGGYGSNQDDRDTSPQGTDDYDWRRGWNDECWVFGNHQESDGNESSVPGRRPRD